MTQLSSVLYQQALSTKCRELTKLIADRSPKELHHFLPHLLSNVFGYDNTIGWSLRSLHPTTQKDNHKAVFDFLCSHGIIFQLISKLEAEDSIFEFPISHLPGPTQNHLHSGYLPPYLSIKDQDGVQSGVVLLNAFEYYMCHFAYFLVHSKNIRQPWTTLQDAVYTRLVDDYCNYFLPPNGIIHPHRPPSPLRFSPLTLRRRDEQLKSSPSQPSSSPRGLLNMSTSPMTHTLQGKSENVAIWKSYTFVEIMADFWLNQVDYLKESHFDLLPSTEFKPSDEHCRIVRLMMKRIHYFCNGHNQITTSSQLSIATANLRSCLVQVYLSPKLYPFLSHAIRNWPMDMSYRYLVELWLTYIQPWRYTDPNKLQGNDQPQIEIDHFWLPYIRAHQEFYLSLFEDFMGRTVQLNLCLRNDVELLFRILKIYGQSDLVAKLSTGIDLGDLDDSIPFQIPLETVYMLRDQIQIAKSQVVIRRAGHVKQSTIPYSQTSSQPVSPSASPQTNASPNQSWLSGAWNWIVDDVEKSPGRPASHPPATSEAEWKKIEEILSKCEEFLGKIFHIDPSEMYSEQVDFGGDASPTVQGVPYIGSPMSPWKQTEPVQPLSGDRPEYIPCTMHLSPLGREQIKSGTKKCTSDHVSYQGDPLLQPIRSYENATLVRLLHQISSYLTRRFSSQLCHIGNSRSFSSRLLKQLLVPPKPSSAMPTTSWEQHTPVHGVSLVPLSSGPGQPRVSLRVFASYYTLAYLAVYCLLLKLLGFGFFAFFLSLICFAFLYAIFSYNLSTKTERQ